MVFAILGDSALAAQASQGPGFYYAKYVGRMVISVLLYLYMFRHQVREYFDIELARPWRWAATQFVLCLALTVMELLVPWLVRPALTGRGLG